jgi:hypothetical protein
MPVPIAELFVSVGADISGATRGLSQLNSQLNNIGSNAGAGFSLANVGKNLRTIGSQAKTTGFNLTQDLTAPILGISAAVFGAGSDFEHAFTEVKRTVTGLDDTQLQDLRKDLLDMSKTPAGGLKTASELAEIAAVGGQLGLAGGDIKQFTSLVARLSLATNLPFAQVADDVGRAINVLGLASSDFERFGSVITKLGNDFGGTEADILEFSRRLGGTLSSLGVKPAQIEAIGAALSAAGVLPEAGATAVNQFFVDMVNSLNETSGASEETKQKLQNLKDTISDLSSNLEVASLRQKEFGRNTPASVVKANQLAIQKYQRDLGQANTKLDAFSQTSAEGTLNIGGMAKVAGVTDEEFRNLIKTDPARAFASFVDGLRRIQHSAGGPAAVTKTLEELGITGDRQRETFLNLANAQQDVTSALNIAEPAWNKQTALSDEVATAMEDMKNQIKLAANVFQTSLIDAFDKQRPAIQALVDQINTDLIPAFKNLVDSIPVLSPDALKALGALAALGPAIIALGAALSIVGAIILVLSAPLTLPIIAVLAGLALVFGLVAANKDTINNAFDNIVAGAKTWGTDFNNALQAAILGAGSIFSAFGTFLDGFFNTVILPIFQRFPAWILEHVLGPVIGLLEFLQTLGITSIPGVTADLGATIADLKAKQTAAAATAGGAQNAINVTINNPMVTSQNLLDQLATNVSNAVTTALITAEKSVIIAPQPLPGHVPGTPF